jgi:pyruvate kinase
MKVLTIAKTKIVATVGPASDSKDKLRKLILAGVDVFRFNMKHGELSWHKKIMQRVRMVSEEMGKPVAILMDLQGPEIRSGRLKDGKMSLKKNEQLWLVSSQDLVYKSKEKMIMIDRIEIIGALKKGQRILMDDGMLEFEVMSKKKINEEMRVRIKTVKGGVLTDRKGVNLLGVCMDMPVLVERDLKILSSINKEEIDWVALSFVAKREDVVVLKKELDKRQIKAGVVAKIERKEALNNFEEILDEVDAVMIARGDLGVEIAYHEVPFWQKKIIKRCREVGKPVITATQMLQSMISCSMPTRAEVSDVANAVYDGTDAVMLSAETSVGDYPIESVRVMEESAFFTESKAEYEKIEIAKKNMGQSAAVVVAANELIECGYKGVCDLSAVVVLTETGTTVRYLSRLRPKLPVIGVTANKKTRDQMKLYWGVKSVYFKFKKKSEMSVRKILEYLKQEKQINKGENVLMIYGELWGKPGLTSVIRIQTVI